MAQSADEYSNLLEQQFQRLPGFVQSVLEVPFRGVDDVVRGIAGQPMELVQAGQGYAALGKQIDAIGTGQQRDRAVILGHAWEGAAYDAFSAQMAQVEQRISSLGQAAAQTQPLLDAAARACTQSADIIVGIVEGFVSWVLQDLIVSTVLSFFTFGAAEAAGAAIAVAKFADTVAEIGGIAEKLAAVLAKIAELLAELANLCKKITTFLTDLQTALTEAKGWAKVAAIMKRAAVTTVTRDGVSYAVDGGPFPGPVGAGAGTVAHGVQAVKDVQQAHG
ncbi:MAG TPA: hypothetical protein VGS19_02115 [Streptosporangiaceae bacterium]|nr:hypothetical protein [Streptosporangiaceae bacterium]